MGTWDRKAVVNFRHVAPLGNDYWSETWQAEYHEGDGFPLGVAWVNLGRDGREPTVFYLFVDDGCRRLGIATKIIEACRERWPGLDLGHAVTEGGRGLMDSLVRKAGEKKD
jgi:hypothetical protein